MKQQTITITGLVFTQDGHRVGRGSVITREKETLAQSLASGALQMGKLTYEAGVQVPPSGGACQALLEGRGEYWLTFSPKGFLLREVPSIEEAGEKA